MFSRLHTQNLKTFVEEKKFELLTVVVFCVLLLFLPQQTFDWGSYVTWAEYIRAHGLSQVYTLSFVDYLPLSILVIHLWQVLAAFMEVPLFPAVAGIKLYPMFFDCLSVFLVLRICRKFNYSRVLAILCLLPNLAFHYNSLIWGQFDAVHTFFVVLTLYALSQKRFFGAILAFQLALNFKLQTLFFLPVIVLFMVWSLLNQKKTPGKKKYLQTFLLLSLLILIQVLIFLPFQSVYSPVMIIKMIFERWASSKDYVTFNADNWWILSGATTMVTANTTTWLLNITYKTWGVLLFLVSSGIALLPMLWETIKSLRSRLSVHRGPAEWTTQRMFECSILTAYICSLSSFFFLTQMHERYAHPTILLSAIFFVARRKPWLLGLSSVAYLINLERVDHFWAFTPILEQSLPLSLIAASCYFIALIYSYWLLIRYFTRLNTEK